MCFPQAPLPVSKNSSTVTGGERKEMRPLRSQQSVRAATPLYLPFCHSPRLLSLPPSPARRRFAPLRSSDPPPPRAPGLDWSSDPSVRSSMSSPPSPSSAPPSAAEAAEAKPSTVLFVCLGNICRSPAAEGVFRDLVKKRGFDSAFNIDSAGTTDYHEVGRLKSDKVFV